jgi:hypothetical protein
MTSQELLTKILNNRINSEISEGTISTDKDISNILDAFVASNKITMDQYTELTNLIASATTTSTATTTTTTA